MCYFFYQSRCARDVYVAYVELTDNNGDKKGLQQIRPTEWIHVVPVYCTTYKSCQQTHLRQIKQTLLLQFNYI